DGTEPCSVWGFGPEGKTVLAIGSHRLLREWDAATGKPVREATLGEPRGKRTVDVIGMVSPDGKRAALTFTEGEQGVGLFDLGAARPVGGWPKGAGAPRGFGREGALLATYRGNEVTVWDPATGKRVGTVQAPGAACPAAAFAPDGSALALGGA